MGCKQSNSYNVEHPEAEESEDATRSNGTQFMRPNSYINTGFEGNQIQKTPTTQPYDSGLPDSLEKEDHNENVFSAPGNSPMKLQIQDEYPEIRVTSPLEEDSHPDQSSGSDNRKSPGNEASVELAVDESVTKIHHQLESSMDRDIDTPLSVNPPRVEEKESASDTETETHIHHIVHKVIDDDLASEDSSTSSMVVHEDIEHTTRDEVLHTGEDIETEIVAEPVKQILNVGTASLPEIVVEMHKDDDDDTQDNSDIHYSSHHESDRDSTADSDVQKDTRYQQDIVVGMLEDDQETQPAHDDSDRDSTAGSDVQKGTRYQQVGDDSDDDVEVRVTTSFGTDKDRNSTHSSDLSGDAAEGNLGNMFQDILQYSEEKAGETGHDDYSDEHEAVTVTSGHDGYNDEKVTVTSSEHDGYNDEKVTVTSSEHDGYYDEKGEVTSGERGYHGEKVTVTSGHEGYHDEKGEVTGHDGHSEEKTTATEHDDDDTSYDLEKHARDTGWMDSDMLPPPEGFSDTEVRVLKVT